MTLEDREQREYYRLDRLREAYFRLPEGTRGRQTLQDLLVEARSDRVEKLYLTEFQRTMVDAALELAASGRGGQP